MTWSCFIAVSMYCHTVQPNYPLSVFLLEVMWLLFVNHIQAMCPLSVELISNILHSSLTLSILALCPSTWPGESIHTFIHTHHPPSNAMLLSPAIPFYLYFFCHSIHPHSLTQHPCKHTRTHFCKQGRINGLCPAALHGQLHDHMCSAGLIFCAQGDFVLEHWGLGIHNQFQSLYLTKQAKKKKKTRN